MLRLADAWVWDFWLADDGRSYHLYFPQAPRRIGDPDEQHHNVSIGHAISPDLTAWTIVSDAITPSDGPAFDDVATWTGSVVRGRDGIWSMFYTGARAADGSVLQLDVAAAVTDPTPGLPARARLGQQTRQADPGRCRGDTALPRRKATAPAAVSITVCPSLTAQHRRSRNGTDSS